MRFTTIAVEKILYIYIAALPFAPRYFSALFINNKLQVSDLLFLILLPVWVIDKFKEKQAAFHWRGDAYSVILALLAATLCSFINSINLLHSTVDWLGLLYLIILFIIVSDIINTPAKFKKILIVYSATAVLIAMVGLGAFIQHYLARNLEVSPLLYHHSVESSVLFFPRIKFLFHTPNMFATFQHIGLAMLFSLFFLFKKEGKHRIANMLLFLSIGVVTISGVLAGSQTLAGISLTIFIHCCPN